MKSPVIKKERFLLNFHQALSKVLEGERITREEWLNEGEFGLLISDGFLGIRRDGKLHTWKLHQMDMEANDWYVI